MQILCWNCRGAASHDFLTHVEDLVRIKDPMLVFILETRVSTAKVEQAKIRLGFDGAHGIDAVGLSGGIWMFWDTARISVDILPHGNQALHAFVQVIYHLYSNFTWLISGIYANVQLEKRCELWEELKTIASNYEGPWSLIGDFNDILAMRDRKSVV